MAIVSLRFAEAVRRHGGMWRNNEGRRPSSGVRFPEFGLERWRALAEKALGGAAFEDALVSRTDDGIRIEPLAPRAPDASPRAVRADPLSPWIVTQRIDDPDPNRANRQALEDIDQGATGLALVFEGAPNAFGYGLPAKPEALAIALHNVPLNRVHIRLDVHPASRASVDWLVALLGKRRADPAKLSVSFGIDPAAIFAGTGRLRMSIEALQASMPQSLAHFFALGLPGILLEGDGRVFHNAGATEAQELGIALASAVSHLRMFEEARQALVYAAPHIGFSAQRRSGPVPVDGQAQGAAPAVGARAGGLLDPAGPGLDPCRDVLPHDDGERIRKPTSCAPRSPLSRRRPAAPIRSRSCRTRIAHGLPDAFARRIARNTQLILAKESHIDFVADPAAGSGSVEALTDALCEAAWDEFRRSKRKAASCDSLVAGQIQSRIVEARDKRAEALSRRQARRSSARRSIRPESERPVDDARRRAAARSPTTAPCSASGSSRCASTRRSAAPQ